MATFRKSKNLGGGVRLNASKSGVGFSFGTKGARISVNSKGDVYRTVGAFGITSRKKLTSKERIENTNPEPRELTPEEEKLLPFSVAATIVSFLCIAAMVAGIFSKKWQIGFYVVAGLIFVFCELGFLIRIKDARRVGFWISTCIGIVFLVLGILKSQLFLLLTSFFCFMPFSSNQKPDIENQTQMQQETQNQEE